MSSSLFIRYKQAGPVEDTVDYKKLEKITQTGMRAALLHTMGFMLTCVRSNIEPPKDLNLLLDTCGCYVLGFWQIHINKCRSINDIDRHMFTQYIISIFDEATNTLKEDCIAMAAGRNLACQLIPVEGEDLVFTFIIQASFGKTARISVNWFPIIDVL